jgi:hypothetical protein
MTTMNTSKTDLIELNMLLRTLTWLGEFRCHYLKDINLLPNKDLRDSNLDLVVLTV